MKFFVINRTTLLVMGVVIALSFLACKKEGSSAEQPAISEQDASTYSTESMGVEGRFDAVEADATTAADEEGLSSSGKDGSLAGRIFPFVHLRSRIGNCAVITVSPNDSTYPKTVTIDFEDGCTGNDGRLRKGKMILTLTAPHKRPGSVLTINLVDFQLNRASVEGTKVITNLAEERGDIKFTAQVIDGKVTYPNGRGYQYESLKYKKQIAGSATDDIEDDVYSIEGNSKTVFNNGPTINLDIVDPLIRKKACDWITEGTLRIRVNARQFKMDYGFPDNGGCDNKALLLWNNKQQVVLLP